MSDRRVARSTNLRFLPWMLLYALMIAYSSTIVGPMGVHYQPLDPEAAWNDFLARASTWVGHGSDQRADWMGNLSMYVPFGFMLTGVLWPRRGAGPKSVISGILAMALSVVFVLAVKYAQIYFPPRTVTLNYVVAQIAGSAIGIALFSLSFSSLARLVWRRQGGMRENLRHILRVYTAAVFVFLLMPLDFALSLEDLLPRAERVPALLFALPGAGRPAVVQIALALGSAAIVAPLGMLLVLAPRGRNRFFGHAMLLGVAWMAGLQLLICLLISGIPTLASLLFRVVGIFAGVRTMRWIIRQEPNQLREWLRIHALWGVLPYLLVLLAVNGLLSTHWQTPAEAIRTLYTLGLLPLFDYYIVSKATAAKNIVAHAGMYAPIGLFVWLRGYRPVNALRWGFWLALLVETARYLRPGLEGDINAVGVGCLAALFTAWMMPWAWRLLEGVTLPTLVKATVTGPGWRERAAAARLREAAQAAAGSGAKVDQF